MNKRKTGTYYEEAAIAYLSERGIKIVDRNVHCGRIGEIDLIGEGEGCLIFFECKYRESDKFGSSLDAVTYSKQKTIRKCAEYYLLKHPTNLFIRFDVIGFDKDICTWIKDAFQV